MRKVIYFMAIHGYKIGLLGVACGALIAFNGHPILALLSLVPSLAISFLRWVFGVINVQ